MENAIVHGLEPKLDNGDILISAWREEGDIYIQVADDGVGMTESSIREILNESVTARQKEHTSIGITNVNKRIRMIYGEKYGIMIQSVPGAGTKITIHLPG